ncbi:hypothetical protein LCGC14_0716480 [marine sediment metagenome]|uniref:DOD-type homing endonuclease domain-containing protein n=1 Tax=marine sediment metagenome TaxID=412755 RepID=A0A0F9SZ70_9ZZZZ
MQNAEVIPLLPGGTGALDKANRERLINYATSYQEAQNEWLRREILEHDRIDILAREVLGYEVQPYHAGMLRFQFLHPDNQQWSFRGAGKTSMLTITKCIHLLCKCRDMRILIASKTVGNSEGFLKEIKAHLEGNTRLAELFGPFYDPHRVGKWDNREIEVVGRRTKAKEASITCVGVEGTVVSKHYDVIISDDLIDEDSSRTKHMRDRVRTWYYQTLQPCLEPPGNRVPHQGEHHRHGTRYHYDDLYGHLQANELKEHTNIVKALSEDEKSPWPEYYPPEHFIKIRTASGSIIFNAQYQCHSEDTEFLTRDGWRLWGDVLEFDKIATFDGTGRLEYQTPTGRTCLSYSGGLLRIRSNTLNALVTPNHQMVVRSADYPAAEWSRADASKIGSFASGRTGRVSIFSGVEWDGTERDNFVVHAPEVARNYGAGRKKLTVSMDAFISFLGYFITEGSTKTSSRGDVRLAQNPGSVLDTMRSTLAEMGLKWKEYGDRTIALCVRHIGLWEWLRAHVKTRSEDAKIPRFVFDLSARQLRIFFHAMIDGDGHTVENSKYPSYQYVTTSAQLADDMQELGTLLRMDVSLKTDPPRTIRKGGRSYTQAHPVHRLCLRRSNNNGVKPEQVIPEPYEGRVVCFSVPNRTLITRLGGKVLASGNCDTESMRGEIFQYDQCQQVDDIEVPSNLKVYMGIDLAISTKETADLFAIVVGGIDVTDNCYVLDYFEGHLRFHEQASAIQRLYKQHDPIRAAIETNAYQAAQYQNLKGQNVDMRLVGIHQDKDKVTRAMKLSARFEAGRMYFRKSTAKLIDQLVGFPGHRYDDGFDALDMMVRVSQRRRRKSRRTQTPGLM